MSLSQSLGKGRDKKNEQQGKEPKSSRTRLEWINGVPTIHQMRMLLAQAEKTRGILCELPIRAAAGTFLLSCQSDHLSNEPCWTLYQGEDGLQQVWSYMNDNVEMINNIVGMSVTGKDAKTDVDLSALGLTPSASSAQESTPTPAAATPAPTAPTPAPAPPTPAPTPTPAPASEPPFDPFMQVNTGWGGATQVQPQAWGQPAPLDPNAGADVWAAPGYTQPAYTPPPYTQPEVQWQSAPPPSQSLWGQAAPGFPAPEMQPFAPSDSPWKSAAPPAGGKSATLAQFAQFLAEKPDITIADLTVDPMVPPQCVDIALRLQEMVLKGHFNEQVALVALKLAAENNGLFDDSIIQRAKSHAAADPNEIARQAAGILQHAGLLTETDIAHAERELEKHKNNFAAALLSSGKIDQLVLDAAQECQPLLAEGKMRQDQAIIALHYCSRSRAKLKDALEDLSIQLL